MVALLLWVVIGALFVVVVKVLCSNYQRNIIEEPRVEVGKDGPSDGWMIVEAGVEVGTWVLMGL